MIDNGMIHGLALARRDLAEAKAAYDEFMAQETPHRLREALEKCKADAAEIDAYVREEALRAYGVTGDKVLHPTVKIRIMTKVGYEVDDALGFCIDHLTAALKLDAKLFEKHAKAVAETAPLDFVCITQEPQVTIATDLSEYV